MQEPLQEPVQEPVAGPGGGEWGVVQSSASLQGFRDTADPPIAGTGGVFTKALPSGVLPGGYYRIRVLP